MGGVMTASPPNRVPVLGERCDPRATPPPAPPRDGEGDIDAAGDARAFVTFDSCGIERHNAATIA